LAPDNIKHSFTPFAELAKSKVIKKQIILAYLDHLRSDIAIDESIVMELFDSQNNFREVVQGDRKWKYIVGLFNLQFQQVSLGIMGDNVLEWALLKLLDDGQNVRGHDFVHDLETVRIIVSKLAEFVHKESIIIFKRLVDFALGPKVLYYSYFLITFNHYLIICKLYDNYQSVIA